MARKATNGDTPEAGHVSEQQLTAIDLIISGQNLQTVADALHVARTTVSRWLNHDPAFIAALNQRRQELWADLVDSLRALAPKAVQVLAQALESDQPMPAALAILRACGLANGALAPSGPTTVEEATAVLQVRAYEAQHAQVDTQVGLRRRDTDRLFAQMAANPLAELLAEGGAPAMTPPAPEQLRSVEGKSPAERLTAYRQWQAEAQRQG